VDVTYTHTCTYSRAMRRGMGPPHMGNLAHKKTPPRSTLQQNYAQGPMVVLVGEVIFYERGIPVGRGWRKRAPLPPYPSTLPNPSKPFTHKPYIPTYKPSHPRPSPHNQPLAQASALAPVFETSTVFVSLNLRSDEHGIDKQVKARFWPWLSTNSASNASTCSLFTRHRN